MKTGKIFMLVSMCLLPYAMKADYDRHHDHEYMHGEGFVRTITLTNRMSEPVDVTVDIRFGFDRHYTLKPGQTVTVKGHHVEEWGIRGVRLNGMEFENLTTGMNIVADKHGHPMLKAQWLSKNPEAKREVKPEIKHVAKKAATHKAMKQAPMDTATEEGVTEEEMDMLTDSD